MIGERAFDNCYRLTSVTIPKSVTSIGERAFRDCTSLTSVYSLIKKVELVTLGKNVFENINKTCTLYVYKRKVADYENADQWKSLKIEQKRQRLFGLF